MKAFWCALPAAALLTALATMQVSAFDHLDDLLAVPAPSANAADTEVSQVPADPLAQFDGDGSALSDTAQWHSQHTERGISTAAATVVDDNSPLAVSVVPEPSAIALAGLATVYFLIFCRRRQYA